MNPKRKVFKMFFKRVIIPNLIKLIILTFLVYIFVFNNLVSSLKFSVLTIIIFIAFDTYTFMRKPS